jgi:nucleoside 2-deoxyribosyltransferase
MHKVYLGGPISGLNYEQSEDWRNKAKRMLEVYRIEGFSPLRRKDYLASEEVIEGSYQINPLSTAKGILARDHFDVSTSNLVLVNFLGAERVSIGTVAEIAFAWKDRIPVVLICEEDNIHWKHPFIEQMVSFRVDALEDAVDLVASILLP